MTRGYLLSYFRFKTAALTILGCFIVEVISDFDLGTNFKLAVVLADQSKAFERRSLGWLVQVMTGWGWGVAKCLQTIGIPPEKQSCVCGDIRHWIGMLFSSQAERMERGGLMDSVLERLLIDWGCPPFAGCGCGAIFLAVDQLPGKLDFVWSRRFALSEE